jgi:hypothetical protein
LASSARRRRTLGGTATTFCLIVDNADAALERALACGALHGRIDRVDNKLRRI